MVLSPDTKYYVRAFAINEIGIAYGDQISFTTPEESPVASFIKAYIFDGTNDYLEINHSSSLNFNQQITISLWAKLETDAPCHYPYQIIEKHDFWGMGQRENGLLVQNTNEVYIGRYKFSRDYFFDSILDDIRIYNRSLTQLEITALYNE